MSAGATQATAPQCADAHAVRRFVAAEDTALACRVKQIRAAARDAHLTPVEAADGVERAHTDRDASVRQVRATFVRAAERFLSETVDTDPDTPAPVLLDQAARCRAHLAALLAGAGR